MEKFFALVILAILVEAVITYVTEIKSIKSHLVSSLLLGIAVSVLYKIDLPATLSITSEVPYVGSVLTGVIMARGSNYIYDLIGRFTNLYKKPIDDADEKEFN